MQSIWLACWKHARRILAGMLCGMLGLAVPSSLVFVGSCIVNREPIYLPGLLFCIIATGFLGLIGGGVGAAVPQTPETGIGARVLIGSSFSALAVALLVSVTIMKVVDPSGYGLVLLMAALFGSIPGALGALGSGWLTG